MTIEAVQLELFRKASPAKRFALMSSFSSTLRKASLKNLEQRFSNPLEARLEWMRLHYGEKIAQIVGNKIQVSRSTVNETEGALQRLVEVFTQLSISYRIVGSVASSAQGMMRATLDVDMVAALESHHIPEFASRLKNLYYIDEELVSEAVARGSSFNLVHRDTMIKLIFLFSANVLTTKFLSRGKGSRP